MSDPVLSRSDACSIRAAAEYAEFAEVVGSVLSADASPLADGDLMLPGRDRRAPYRCLRQVLNEAPTSILHRFGFTIRQLGTAGAQLVAGNRGQGTGAGR
jgi:hypothetical protein